VINQLHAEINSVEEEHKRAKEELKTLKKEKHQMNKEMKEFKPTTSACSFSSPTDYKALFTSKAKALSSDSISLTSTTLSLIPTNMDSTSSVKFQGSTDVNYNIKTKNSFEILDVEETKVKNDLRVSTKQVEICKFYIQNYEPILEDFLCNLKKTLWCS